MERDLHFYLPAFFLSHYFNSHAHVERDMLKWEITLLAIISTHTLTWSVTFNAQQYFTRFKISTHTLTWSVTFVKAIADIILIDFNSHAHVERDAVRMDFRAYNIISTHTLTWSVTIADKFLDCIQIFQLTRSRGAWRLFCRLHKPANAFQLTRSRGAWPDHK